MAEILDLPNARTAIRLQSGDTSNDTDLTNTYLPAVTSAVEDVVGPVMVRTGIVFTASGGVRTIALPEKPSAVTGVTEDGVALSASGYFVTLSAGLITRGQPVTPWYFAVGSDNVVITYSAGYAATPAAVGKKIQLAARIILRHLWQADQQGNASSGRSVGSVDVDVFVTPAGFAIPRRAYELLHSEWTMPGFA